MIKNSALWRAKIRKITEDREAEELLVEAPWHKQCAKCKFFSPILSTISNYSNN